MPEEEFVPGVDPGVKAWLVMREASRNAKLKGSTGFTIPCDIPYKYHQYWIDILFSLKAEELNILSTMNELQFAQWSPIINEDRRTIPLAEFEAMIYTRTLDTLPDIILTAIDHRSMAYMNRIVEMGLKLDTPIGPWGRTALMLTAMRGDTRKLRFLLEQGAQVNAKDKLGLTAMHLCINPESIFHTLEIPRMLLEFKSRVNVIDKKRRTPLHYACIIGSLALVEILLKQEADMTVLDLHEKLAIDYTNDPAIHKEFDKYAIYRARRPQFVKMNARLVARCFVGDLFNAVQPKCKECKRTLAKCSLMKKENYKYWLYAHARLRGEKYHKDKISISYSSEAKK